MLFQQKMLHGNGNWFKRLRAAIFSFKNCFGQKEFKDNKSDHQRIIFKHHQKWTRFTVDKNFSDERKVLEKVAFWNRILVHSSDFVGLSWLIYMQVFVHIYVQIFVQIFVGLSWLIHLVKKSPFISQQCKPFGCSRHPDNPRSPFLWKTIICEVGAAALRIICEVVTSWEMIFPL